MPRHQRLVFDGWIAGLGTASGTRLVIGRWPRSPFGGFTDVMIEDASGHRRLLAPRREVADFVAATYTFDAVEIAHVGVTRTRVEWALTAGPLNVAFEIGRRPPLGYLLRAVPPPLARRPAWISAIDRPARWLLPGVRTVGSAGHGRREYYGAQDLRPITAVVAWLDGTDLGPLASIDPPVRFGFGSVPPAPALVRVTTTVELPR
ncbi:hypothetical protein [Sporichthya polymorpha]|uniref:hypothetical protein n=1 Tax=Sporichthya polymorpha TaxID=35751 RepID=UPI000370561D|nr:hypothetical protein [Sporichthya polymorpha]